MRGEDGFWSEEKGFLILFFDVDESILKNRLVEVPFAIFSPVQSSGREWQAFSTLVVFFDIPRFGVWTEQTPKKRLFTFLDEGAESLVLCPSYCSAGSKGRAWPVRQRGKLLDQTGNKHNVATTIHQGSALLDPL